MLLPQAMLGDAGYIFHVVYAFFRESGEQFEPSFGRGAAQQRHRWDNRPTRAGSVVKQLGEGDHLNRLRAEKLLLTEVNASPLSTSQKGADSNFTPRAYVREGSSKKFFTAPYDDV